MRIITYPDASLLEVCDHIEFPLTIEELELCDNMEQYVLSEYCLGLAAPQIGWRARVFVAHSEKELIVCINPHLVLCCDLCDSEECCLSLPSKYYSVKRNNKCILSYSDKSGKIMTAEYAGMDAIILQHEYDHLNGILINAK